MRTLQTAFWMCCSLLFTQPLQAAPGGGYVIQWSTDSAANGASSAKLVASNAVAVSAGWFHSLALKPDGTVYGWGGDSHGSVLGSALPEPVITNGIVRISGQMLSNVVSVVASREHSLALKADGSLVTWGHNYIPSVLTNATAIATGWNTSWALKHEGTIVGWVGDPPSHQYGQLIRVEALSNIVAIAVGPWGHGTRGVALKRDGTVATWGTETINKEFTAPPAGLRNVVAIAAGAAHSLALKSDGTVVGWGSNGGGESTGTPNTNSADGLDFISAGQVRIGGQVLSNVVSIGAGTGYSLALKKDGTLVKWGNPPFRKMVIPAGLSNVVAIAAGAEDFCLAITTTSDVAARFSPAK